jgi:hypothetical protein
MPPVSVRYRWTLEDLLAGRKITLRLQRSLFYFRVALGAALLGLAVWNYRVGDSMWVFYLAMTAVLAVALLAKALTQNLLLRRQFSKRPDANVEVEWVVSDHGIVASTPHSKSEIQWSAFQRVIFAPAGFVFMPNRQIFHFLPIRAFESPEDIGNLKSLARQHATEFKEFS